MEFFRKGAVMNAQIYCIYKYTSPSGKAYIGQTNDFYRRSRMHKSKASKCTAFANAVLKYGYEAFVSEILEDNLTMEEANNKEKLYIIEHNTRAPNGYNLLSGGDNGLHSEETLTKKSIAMKLFYANNPEERIVQAERTKMRMATQEAKSAFQARMSNPEVRKKAGEKIRATNGSPEARAAQAERARIQMSTPEARKAATERGIAMYSTPISRARTGVASATGWAKKIGRPFSLITYS